MAENIDDVNDSNPFSADFRIACVESASQWLGSLNGRTAPLVGVNKGQFSFLDLIRAVLDQIGPADMVLSTWTAGIQDVEHARWLIDNRHVRSMWWLVDRSFATRQQAYCERLVELFGDGCLLASNTHAKFATLRNEAFDVVITTSANLNRNRRLEQFAVFLDRELADQFDGIIGELESIQPRGATPPGDVVDDCFSRALAEATCGDVLLAELGDVERWARLGYTPRQIFQRQQQLDDDFHRGAWSLEDRHREQVIAASESGDARARDQVWAWISAQKRDI